MSVKYYIAMKSLIILIPLLIISTNAYADWIELSSIESGRLIEIDTKRSKKIINNYVAFARTYLNEQYLEIKTEINCLKKTHKLLLQKITDSRGKVISDLTSLKQWEPIAQDSIYEVLMQYFCK